MLFRTLQGLCGAALMPLSQAILLDINPKERHGRAMAIWGMGVVLGPILGPLLGGWLTEDYSWRWVFYVNVPFGMLAALGIAAYLPETRQVKSRFDLFGFATLGIGIGALAADAGSRRAQGLVLLHRDPDRGADRAGRTLFCSSCTPSRSERPFINRALFHDRNFVIGNVFIFMIGVVLFATMALLPPMMQALMGYPGADRRAGDRTARHRHLGGDGGGGALDRPYSMRAGSSLSGFGLCVISMWQMAGLSPQAGQQPLVVSGVIQGFGTGLSWVALHRGRVFDAPGGIPRRGRVDVQSAAQHRQQHRHLVDPGVRDLGHAGRATRSSCSTSTRMGSTSTSRRSPRSWRRRQAPPQLNAAVATQASWIAYLDAFRLMMILLLLVIPLLLFVRRVKSARDAPTRWPSNESVAASSWLLR